MAQKEEATKSSEESKPKPPPADTAIVIASTAAPALSWFTPKRLLVIFCLINLINYVDRGTIASNEANGSLKTCTDSDICTAGTEIHLSFHLGWSLLYYNKF
ncbi:hypothetical protein ACFX1T_022782 [Malus domestica]